MQTEDDITASVVVPADQLRHLPADARAGSYKFAVNCEYRLFQRPDDAVHRGLDQQTEADLARPDNFLSNFEPLTAEQARDLVDRVTEFDEFTAPMRELLQAAAEAGSGTVVCSAYPRLVDGKPSKNPRYLQIRPDLLAPRVRYVAERGMRLARGITGREPLPDAGRRRADRPAQQPARPRRRASGRWPSTARSTTRSCPSCSWTSSARSPARARRRRAPARRGR